MLNLTDRQLWALRDAAAEALDWLTVGYVSAELGRRLGARKNHLA